MVYYSEMLTVREQQIDVRLDKLEFQDIINIASGKLDEDNIDEILFGKKLLNDEAEMEALL